MKDTGGSYVPRIKMIQDEFDITLAVLSNPLLHYRACCYDDAGRPEELSCCCPLKSVIDRVIHAEIIPKENLADAMIAERRRENEP